MMKACTDLEQSKKLAEILPLSSYLGINKEDEEFQPVYTDPYGDFEGIETGGYDDFVDACYDY